MVKWDYGVGVIEGTEIDPYFGANWLFLGPKSYSRGKIDKKWGKNSIFSFNNITQCPYKNKLCGYYLFGGNLRHNIRNPHPLEAYIL
jgi:hypothetical protein